MDQQDLARMALSAIPGVGTRAARTASVTRLAGLTNIVFKVAMGPDLFCLRIPGPGTSAIIDRHAEEVSARAAAALGIAPEVLYFGKDGVMLTRFIEDAALLSPDALRSRPGALERVAAALRDLHDGEAQFGRDFRVFEIMEDYLAILRSGGAAFPDGVPGLLDQAASVRQVLAERPQRLRPCHCDPTGGNLLDTGTRVFLIDWEYSGMNDLAWDLAYLSLEASFDNELDARLLAAYHRRLPTAAETGRVAITKPLCDLLSGLWALIQQESAPCLAEYRTHADARLERCAAAIRAPDFAKHLTAVRDG